ncbi:unnamed protein product [Pleuronectes platessa]|uniref:Uncharacterized protein n=1 Tax=Pleuronectes platessa TaxID=8262 RepID=A0A9N7TL37_PLEPL|nr:unnamed protein product [Pleuronectes platessa]
MADVKRVRLLYCSLEEAALIFRAALAAGQAGPSHMWFAVGPALSGLGLEGLPKALFAIRPQGWRDEPRRRIAKGVSVLTHGAMALRRDLGTNSRLQYAGNCQSDGNQTHRVHDRISERMRCSERDQEQQSRNYSRKHRAVRDGRGVGGIFSAAGLTPDGWFPQVPCSL